MKTILQTASLIFLLSWNGAVRGSETTVHDAKTLRSELQRAQPGDVILLAPGNYGNGIWIEKIYGTKKNPILITGTDIRNPPVFAGGKTAILLSNCNYIILRNMRISGSSANGINASDGGSFESPSKGLVFNNITFEDIGPTGNRDALKLSGLNDFVVTNCRFSGWGGSAIDMVGCHDGVIEKCKFIGRNGFSQTTGVQAKGGSENILIKRNFFKNAGSRAVNIGGSTGLEFFRPKLRNYEAKSIKVVGNHFIGSEAPIAYVTSTDCVVRLNTIIAPEKWVIRILQEQPGDRFMPCQKGVFERNLIVYNNRLREFVNVGANTKPETFHFQSNAWFCTDGERLPSLPSKESEGIYQIDPELVNAETPDLKMRSKNPRLRDLGAHALGNKDR